MNQYPTSPSSTPSAPFPIPELDQVLATIEADATSGVLSHWATSTVIDELTNVPSISEELFTTLHESAGIQTTFPVGNAGLIHVYGYWFSNVLTPFGYKRDRWLNGELARALSLPASSFLVSVESPDTLLTRVTNAALPILQEPSSDTTVAETHIEEALYRVVLTRKTNNGPYALIYGVARRTSEKTPSFQLITTFPYTGDPATICEEFVASPRLRWNAANRT